MPFEPIREGQLSEKELKWGYWWVTHKLQLKKLLTLVLAVIAFLLVSYASYGFADWFFGSGVRERAAIAQMANTPTGYPAIHSLIAPQPLNIENPIVLVSGSDSYDLVSRVTNRNADWRAELDWHFEAAGQATGLTRHTVVLPGDNVWLVQLGVKSKSRPVSVGVAVDKRQWRRLDKHQVQPDYASWAGERLDVEVSDVEFTPAQPTDPLSISRATFQVANKTGYGYWRVSFFVTLWDGGSLVGVNYVTASQLRAGETRTMDASWFTALPRVTRVEVSPEIDIFDQGNYMPLRQ
jgi:hypothetical protein